MSTADRDTTATAAAAAAGDEAAAAAAAAAAAERRRKKKNKRKKKKNKAPAEGEEEKQEAAPKEEEAAPAPVNGGSAQLVAEATRPLAESVALGGKPLDAHIFRNIARRLLVLALNSEVVFQLARKHAGKSGRGCVTWYFPDVDEAEVGGDEPREEKQAIHFLTAEKVAATEHASACRFVREYHVPSTFAVLVAVRSGDTRDSLMRSMVFGRHSHLDERIAAAAGEVAAVEAVQMRMPNGTLAEVQLNSGRKFCDALPCCKYESARDEYKSCALCGNAVYCSRECQRVDWKRHKFECKTKHAARLAAAQKAGLV